MSTQAELPLVEFMEPVRVGLLLVEIVEPVRKGYGCRPQLPMRERLPLVEVVKPLQTRRRV